MTIFFTPDRAPYPAPRKLDSQQCSEVQAALRWLGCVSLHRYSFSESRATLLVLADTAPQSEIALKIIDPVLKILRGRAYSTEGLSEAVESAQLRANAFAPDFFLPSSPVGSTPAPSTQVTPERDVVHRGCRGGSVSRRLFADGSCD